MKPRTITAPAVDYRKPLPDHDPLWGAMVVGLSVVSWACCLVALHWALS